MKLYTLIIGIFNTPLSPVDRSTGQNPNREIRELTHIMTQKELTIIYRTFYPNPKNMPSSQHLLEPSMKLIT